MNKRELPPTLKNQVFDMLQAAGLDWSEFDWQLVKGPWAHLQVSIVTHLRTGFFFLFDVGHQDDFHPKSYPGREWPDMDGASMIQVCKSWVDQIAIEIKAPDLWALAAGQGGIGTDPTGGNSHFTPDEQRQIGEGLQQLEEYVFRAEPELPPEKRQAVSARFKYLRDAVARLGRLDWMSLVVGQLFAMASEKIITVQTFTSLYHMAGGLLGKFLAAGAAALKLAGL